LKNYLWIFFLALVAPKVYAISPIVPKQIIVPQVNSSIWDGYSELKHICSCESWGDPNKEPREFKDGSVLYGFPNPKDVGACQINTPIWGAQAQKLGDDLYSYDGNIAFAKWLYNQQGNKPWGWSKSCWAKA
jgi:hypothetical protein